MTGTPPPAGARGGAGASWNNGRVDPVQHDRVPAGTSAPVTSEPSAAASGAAPAGTPVEVVEEGRSTRSPKDMAMSLLVLLIPIALLMGFSRFILGGEEPNVVDPTEAVAQARTAGLAVREPVDLSTEWRTLTARSRSEEAGVTLRVGYLSPDGEGVQVVQSNAPADQLLRTELTDSAKPQGQVVLADETWQLYSARRNEQAYVLLTPELTVVVVGSAPDAELRELAQAHS